MPAAPQVLVAGDVLALLAPRVQAVFHAKVAALAEVLGSLTFVAAATPSFDALFWSFRHIQGYQAWHSLGPTIERYKLQLGPGVAERFAWSSTITAQQMEQHALLRDSFRASLRALLGRDKVLLLPTMPDIAPLLSESEATLDDYRNQAIRMLCLSGLSGLPQISLPLMQIDGAPLGCSLIGPYGSDQTLIAFARKVHDAAV